MKTFRFDPASGHLTDQSWRFSTLSPITCWVMAENAHEAEHILTVTTTVSMTPQLRNKSVDTRPWENPGLATCIHDPNRDAPRRFILTAKGDRIVCLA